MKVFVTGAKGQLGSDVMTELNSRGFEAVGVDIDSLDITDQDAVNRLMEKEKPDVVIHCAAWTAVDAAQDHEEECRNVNARGTEYLARACGKQDCKMLYLSTDYVFDGQGERPWQPDDPVTKPLNVYGQTKYEGEQAVRQWVPKHFIVRIAWVFGMHGNNFVKTMLRIGKTHDVLTVVDDQFGTPTYTPDLAVLLADMISTDQYGTYHATNEGGYISWYDFAREIFRTAGMSVTVKPVSSEEYGAKAIRPFNSRLDKSRLSERGFKRLPPWQDALARYIRDMHCI